MGDLIIINIEFIVKKIYHSFIHAEKVAGGSSTTNVVFDWEVKKIS